MLEYPARNSLEERRKASLEKAGLSHIPVISLNANGMEKNEGFQLPLPALKRAANAVVYGDLLMCCLYRVRPYEITLGSVNALHRHWRDICIDSLTNDHSQYTYKMVCRSIVEGKYLSNTSLI